MAGFKDIHAIEFRAGGQEPHGFADEQLTGRVLEALLAIVDSPTLATALRAIERGIPLGRASLARRPKVFAMGLVAEGGRIESHDE